MEGGSKGKSPTRKGSAVGYEEQRVPRLPGIVAIRRPNLLSRDSGLPLFAHRY